REWEEQVLRPALRRHPERRESFTTVSDVPISRLYTAEDLAAWDPAARLGFPGEPPFTRGIHPTMYRGRPWTMRQFAGFGSAEDTNGRFHYLLRHGQTGLSVAFDLPTLMGRDSDDALAEGEVGREGVAIDTLADMEILFREIPLDRVSTSMTINAPAAVLLAMYLAVAERQGAAWSSLRGTVQNDILKEYIAQKEWIFPPAPSMRLIVDMMAFCADSVPLWNTISISGYHIREAGSTAVQELAFTLADGIAYAQAGVDRGLPVDSFAPRLSFFFNAHNDLFEEVAKLRAARRLWQGIMRDRFGARDPRSWMLRTHVQTAGCSLTAQQPLNNVVRVAVQALAAVLGGTQSLHTNSLDETLALPTEDSARLALRTQQILAEESGVSHTIDPLAGSYFVETLTDRTEEAAADYIRRIDDMGGMIAAIERGFPQREIAEASYHYQRQVDAGERTIVGVNRFVDEERVAVPVLKIDPEVERRQLARLAETRRSRDAARHTRALRRLQEEARGTGNLMPPLLEAVKAQASVGEICAALKDVFGIYREGTVPL
ncbi:MAG TPA: methylmalonyl-CoA mutase family protein, partial [Candidatus Polarisedimenticolia bacterium]|nr:methylmalonyl-CoA mutase family protein [Candidatus Polarisedimenticolia bacterium]